MRHPKLVWFMLSVCVYHNGVNVGEAVWGGVGYGVSCVDWRGLIIRLENQTIRDYQCCNLSTQHTSYITCGRPTLVFFALRCVPSSSVLVALTLTSSGNGRNTATLDIERGTYVHCLTCVGWGGGFLL